MSPNARPTSPNSVLEFSDDDTTTGTPFATHLGFAMNGEFYNFDLEETLRRCITKEFVEARWLEVNNIPEDHEEQYISAMLMSNKMKIIDLMENARGLSEQQWIDLMFFDVVDRECTGSLHWMDWFMKHGRRVGDDEGHADDESLGTFIPPGVDVPEHIRIQDGEDAETVVWDPLPIDQDLVDFDLDLVLDYINE
ncbi:MAG: hypothetical protein GY749_47340 [Desulfobacteraceae bacterium]|nr:hypothetical protein [Desulfobacteraceae bacterium]